MKQFYDSCLKVVIGSALSLMMIFAMPQIAQATHIIGGDLTYACLGNNMYQVTLELRRDCLPGNLNFDNEISISVLNGNGVLLKGVATGGEIIIPFTGAADIATATDCDVLGGDVCVETTTYTTTVELPFNANGYILAYQRCCYNSTVINIVNPLNTGLTAWIRINPAALTNCNSSPVFNSWEEIYICQGDLHTFDHSAIDADSNDLVYSLCIPNAGASADFPRPQPILDFPPFQEVTFNSGYGLGNLLGGSGAEALSIDPNTGVLTVTPGTLGQFLVGICIQEFRNGVLLGQSRRVFEYNVRLCNISIETSFTTDENPDCDELEVTFTNTSTNSGGTLDCNWTFTNMVGDTIGTSTDDVVDFTFPTTGSYTATLICSDEDCADMATETIGVSFNDPVLDFDVTAEGCDDNLSVLGVNNSTSAAGPVTCDWIFVDEDGNISNDPGIVVSRAQKISVTLTCTNPIGCSASETRSFDVSGISVELEIDDVVTCGGEDVVLFNDPDGEYVIVPSMDINIGANGDYTVINPTVTTSYSVTKTEGDCEASQDVTLTVLEDVIVTLADVVSCDGNANLNPGADPTCTYEWSSDNGFTSQDPNPSVIVTADTEYTVVVTKGTCSGSATMTVTLLEGGAIGLMDFSTCTDVPTPLNPNPNVTLTSYTWTSSPVGFSSNEENPIVRISTSTTYTVTGQDINGCDYEETMMVTVLEAPVLNVAPELDQCEGTCVDLNPNGDTNLIYTWICDDEDLVFNDTDANPNVCVTENTLCVVTASDGMCSTSASVIINFLDGPGAVNLLGGSHCNGNSFTLNADGLPVGTYAWEASDPNLAFNTTSAHPVVSVSENTVFTVTVTGDNGCQVVEQTIVNLGMDVMIEFPDTIVQCQGTSVSLNPNGSSDFSYNWDPTIPGVLNDPADPFPVVSLLVDTEFCVTVTSDDGCVQNACILVQVAENPDINFEPDSYTVCAGTEVCIFSMTGSGSTGSGMGGGMTGSGSGGGMTGSGTMSGSGIFTETGSGINIFGTGTGSGSTDILWCLSDGTVVGMGDPFCITADMNYSLVAKATNEFGCVGMDTINIIAAPAINLEVGAIGGPFCVGDLIQFEAMGDGSFDVVWFLSDSTEIGTGTVITWMSDGSTPIWAVADNGLGCTEVMSVDLEYAPTIDLTVDLANNGCGNITLTAGGAYTMVTWFMGDMELGTGSPFTTDIDSTKIITAVATNDAGCEETIEEEIIIEPLPSVDIEINGMLIDTISICPGDMVDLNAITSPAGIDVVWSTDETTNMISVNPTTMTEYCVTATDANDCSDVTCITVNTDGGLDIAVESDPEVFCEGDMITLTATSLMGNIVSCDWGPDGTGVSITVTPDGATTYSVTCTDDNGCTGEASITPTPSSKDVMLTGPSVVCEGGTGTIMVEPANPDCTYAWSDGGSGTSIDVSGPGTYSVTATDSNSGCTAEASFDVTDGFDVNPIVSALPDAIAVGETSTLCVEEPTGDGYSYEWFDNGVSIGIGECIDVTPSTTTTYTVVVTNPDNCPRNGMVTVTVSSSCIGNEPDIPNMFTPNGDNSNDCYQLENFTYTTMKLIIYDRWGQQVFMTMNNECWNGQFENTGKLLNPDVYGYHLEWTCEDGSSPEGPFAGNITLLR